MKYTNESMLSARDEEVCFYAIVSMVCLNILMIILYLRKTLCNFLRCMFGILLLYLYNCSMVIIVLYNKLHSTDHHHHDVQ